ncbi:Ubiquitin carboxyl-terminal hydrolase family protein [Acanthocheilonema viteae]
MSKGTSSKRRYGCKTLREQSGTSDYIRSSTTGSSNSNTSLCPLIFNGPSLPGGDINRSPPKNMSCEPSTSNVSNQIATEAPDLNSEVLLTLPVLPTMDTTGPLSNLDDNNHCYVGLVNQAMTCYLNSLIQTLYMTPEFRNAIYGWKFTGSEAAEARSIPCQLQKLFLLLQTSDRESLETIDLTASFGWSNSEAYEQHDIQELCRIMFDALKQKWSKADASFQELYRGNMEDFVKCLFCQKENVKQDEFLDLPLAVKQFGASDAFKSVEEALHAFIKPEVLEGSNQYYCEGCRKKQNALKGLRIIKFPYLLSIQLKRFDFDCNTLHRIKLNDKMTFPALLNLNEFVYDATKSEPPKKMSWASAVSMPRKKDEPTASKPNLCDYVSRAEQNDGHLDEQEVDMLLKRDGPFLYELFSVMVHQGSASGGHYFAYIKNMDQDKWFCFNDSSVTSASIEDIHRTFGGSSGGWSSGNTNAYMLMYRQIDRKRNARFVKTDELADHLLERLRRFEEQEEEKLREKQYRESLVSVNAMFNGAHIISDVTNLTEAMKFPYTAKLSKIYDTVFQAFCAKISISASNVRLLLCKDFTYSIIRSFTKNEMQKTLEEICPGCSAKSLYRPIVYFLLDVKLSETEQFYHIYEEESVGTVKLIALNIENGTFLPAFQMQYHDNETMSMIKQKLGQIFHLCEDKTHNLRLVVDRGIAASPTMVLLDDDSFTCAQALLNVTNVKLYVDAGGDGYATDEDRKIDFDQSKMFSLLERKNHAKILMITLPTPDDYVQAGIIPPVSHDTSRSTTPIGSMPADTNTTTSSGSCSTVIDLHSVPTSGIPETLTMKQTTPSMASSHLSSIISEEDNSGPCLDGDGDMDSVSTTCTPMVSPVVSDSDDTADITTRDSAVDRISRYERTYDAVMAASEQKRLFEMESTVEVEASTAGSSSDTLVGGTHTYISGTTQSSFDVIIRKSRMKSSNDMEVDVDDRQLVIHMKKWLSAVIGIDTNEFVVLKHYSAEDADGYESIINETETIHDAYYAVHRLSIKLRSPLKENEKLMRIIRFDRENADQDKWPTLFSIAVTVDMLIRTLLMRCQEQMKKMYATKYDLNQLRLREVIVGGGAPVLFLGDQLGRRGHEWSKNLYLQILSDEEVTRAKMHISTSYPVMVRRWKSSVPEVTSLVELMVPVDRQDQIVALKEQISFHYRVPFDQIQLSEAFPTAAWSKWPYTKDRVDLYENVSFISDEVPSSGTFNGKLIYFKLANEQVRQLTEEEKRTLRYKDSAAKPGDAAILRRKERPLRIQLSTSITEDDD